MHRDESHPYGSRGHFSQFLGNRGHFEPFKISQKPNELKKNSGVSSEK